MTESWVIEGDWRSPVPPEAAAQALRARVDAGLGETWLTHANGRSLGLVTNGERAMVMLLADEDDPGEHAVDPGAGGVGDGYVLANGQHDKYPNRDTVPLVEAYRLVEHVVRTGDWPLDAPRAVDR
ncbi:hypothetical protein [Streptomyces sp. HNS054]|uniref:hypothetical protein n=1 Tax=Streptomyces sp. HNS054 TaxID=1662446 RepID=UPI000652C285|nr:hypothetical protein [Streptomyces sp. HNS054]WPW23146.1 hypothetical protein UBV09_32670 [Streptomyces griseoincarnatus]